MSVTCPVCRTHSSSVRNTKHRFEFQQGTRQMVTIRLRKCSHCGSLFKSLETTISEPIRLHVAAELDEIAAFENNSFTA